MFTIDLLKGQGKPPVKYHGTLLLCVSAMLIPAIVLLILSGQYFIAKAAIPSAQSQIQSINKQIQASSKDLEYHNKINNQIKVFNDCMGELTFALNQQTVWTPILIEIVANMPDEVIMDEFNVQSRNFTEKVPSKKDPKKMVSVTKTKRTVGIIFSSPVSADSDMNMQKYIWKLRELGLNASMKNQEIEELDNSRVKKYQIEFIVEHQ